MPTLGFNQDGPTGTLPSACDHTEASSCWLPVSAIKNPKESFGLTSSYHHSRDPQPLSFNYPAQAHIPYQKSKKKPDPESLSIQALQAFITSGFYLIYRVSEAMLIVQNGQDHVSMLYVRSS